MTRNQRRNARQAAAKKAAKWRREETKKKQARAHACDNPRLPRFPPGTVLTPFELRSAFDALRRRWG